MQMWFADNNRTSLSITPPTRFTPLASKVRQTLRRPPGLAGLRGLHAAHLILFLAPLSAAIHPASGQSIPWHESEGIYGGTVRIIDRDRSGRLLAITYSKLFFSTDEGKNWHVIPSIPTTLDDLTALCIDSAGTMFVSHRYGIIKSTDLGATWTTTGILPLTSAVRSLYAVDSVILAGTYHQGLFRSIDHGATWVPCSADTLTAQIFFRVPAAVLAGSENGILRSTDEGLTWQSIHIPGSYIRDFELSEAGTVYAISSSSSGGLFVSYDAGATWDRRGSVMPYSESCILLSTGDIILSSFWGMYSSTDSGGTWSSVAYEYLAAETIVQGRDSDLIAGTVSTGVVRSSDNGRSWRVSSDGITAARVGSIAVDDAGHAYAVVWKTVYRSFDFGKTFQPCPRTFGSEPSTLSVDQAGHVYAVVQDSVYVSTDHGDSWNLMSAGIWQPLWVITSDTQNGIIGVTRSGSVYRSPNGGVQWNFVQQLEGDLDPVAILIQANGFGFITRGANAGEFLYRTTDYGASWTLQQTGVSTNGVNALCELKNGDILLGTNGAGVLRSTDHGVSWMHSDSGLPSYDGWIRFLATSGDNVFMYVWSYYYPPGAGMYRSTDNGWSWRHEYSGLPNDFVLDIRGTAGGYSLACTQSNGVFWTYDAPTGVARALHSAGFVVERPFPNPFNPQTTISFYLEKEASVSASVFDCRGRIVDTQELGKLQEGTHSFTWNAKGESSGTYYCRLDFNGTTVTRKLVLLK